MVIPVDLTCPSSQKRFKRQDLQSKILACLGGCILKLSWKIKKVQKAYNPEIYIWAIIQILQTFCWLNPALLSWEKCFKMCLLHHSGAIFLHQMPFENGAPFFSFFHTSSVTWMKIVYQLCTFVKKCLLQTMTNVERWVYEKGILTENRKLDYIMLICKQDEWSYSKAN